MVEKFNEPYIRLTRRTCELLEIARSGGALSRKRLGLELASPRVIRASTDTFKLFCEIEDGLVSASELERSLVISPAPIAEISPAE